MLTGSWPPRKRLSVAAIAIATIIVFTTISNLHYRSSDSGVQLRLPSYNKGNDPTEQETGRQFPSPPPPPSPAHVQDTYGTC